MGSLFWYPGHDVFRAGDAAGTQCRPRGRSADLEKAPSVDGLRPDHDLPGCRGRCEPNVPPILTAAGPMAVEFRA
jgi:hypothetical protein